MLLDRLTFWLAFLMVLSYFCVPVMAAEPEQPIWDFLMELTENPMASAGIMGNLYYESALNPKAVQHPDGLSLDMDAYTRQSQLGIHEDFAGDGCGYGLAQWTYPKRKLRLLELAEAQGCSIGETEVQLQLLGEELENYNMLYRISHADSIRFASDYFLINYENPAVQTEEIKEQRARKGQYYYDKFTKPAVADDGLTQAQRDVIRIALQSDSYGVSAEKGYCMAWVTAVYRAADLQVVSSPSALSSAGAFAVSTDLAEIPVGAAIYGKRNQKYGHVGLYTGKGLVYHNVGGAVSDSLEDWIQQYEGFCWGWPGGIDLTTLP